MECFHIVRDSYTASLSIKTRFYETSNLFISKNKQIYVKAAVPERTLKKEMFPFFEKFCLRQQ